MIQSQMVSPENINTGSIIHTEQAIFRNIHVYTYSYMHVIMKKFAKERGHEFESLRRGI